MYGFRYASAGWLEDWQDLLITDGCKIAVANPALFHNAKRRSRGAVHGDDFVVLASKKSSGCIGRVVGEQV